MLGIFRVGIVQVVDGKRLHGLFNVLAAKAEPECRVQAVNNMQVVRPAFGPVFPRVDRGIRTDVPICPVTRRSLLEIAFQRCAVVFSLIAEQGSEFLQPRRSVDEPIPIVVPNLMSKVSQQCDLPP